MEDNQELPNGTKNPTPQFSQKGVLSARELNNIHTREQREGLKVAGARTKRAKTGANSNWPEEVDPTRP
jgi:hypothetical protein